MDAGAEWSDFEAQAGALDNTSTQDCATACKALDSLARAAEHICQVAPDQCEAAKARVKNASERVHAACPTCETRAEATGTAPAGDTVLVAQSAPRSGCAGCAISGTNGDAELAVLGAVLLAGIGWRRRRRDHLRRVRDALRVESDTD